MAKWRGWPVKVPSSGGKKALHPYVAFLVFINKSYYCEFCLYEVCSKSIKTFFLHEAYNAIKFANFI